MKKQIFLFTTCLSLFVLSLTGFAQEKAVFQNLSIDITKNPFSYKGSYMCLTRWDGWTVPAKPLALHHVGGKGVKELLRLHPVENGKRVAVDTTLATPGQVDIKTSKGDVSFTFQDSKILRGKSIALGCQLQFSHNTMVMPIGENRYRLITKAKNMGGDHKYALTVLKGKVSLNVVPEEEITGHDGLEITISPEDNNAIEFALEEFISVWQPRSYKTTFEECTQKIYKDLLPWMTTIPTIPEEYQYHAQLATYLHWSGLVEPRGFVTRYGFYISKIWMPHIFMHDILFPAMSTSYGMPEVAMDQLRLCFDLQDEYGCIPDLLNDYKKDYYGIKPPWHGWAIQKMIQNSEHFTIDKVSELYEPLCKWTEMWFKYMDDNRDGVVQYNLSPDSHRGSSIYLAGTPIERPNYNAFLALQMEVLADMAEHLGRTLDAEKWREDSQRAIEVMIEKCWNGEQFVFNVTGTDRWEKDARSSALYFPLILGKRLPEEIRTTMIKNLKKEMLTDYGIAAESPRSKYFVADDGYWRGAIWGPTNFIIIDGLEACGELELAKDLAKRFCDLCVKGGFAENFHPLNGKPQCDPSYYWTSGAFIVLANRYLTSEK